MRTKTSKRVKSDVEFGDLVVSHKGWYRHIDEVVEIAPGSIVYRYLGSGVLEEVDRNDPGTRLDERASCSFLVATFLIGVLFTLGIANFFGWFCG